VLNEFPENSEILKMVSERNLLDAVLGEFQILPDTDPSCCRLSEIQGRICPVFYYGFVKRRQKIKAA